MPRLGGKWATPSRVSACDGFGGQKKQRRPATTDRRASRDLGLIVRRGRSGHVLELAVRHHAERVAYVAGQLGAVERVEVQLLDAALQQLAGGSQAAAPEAEAPQDYTPAVSVRKSLASPDHIISMIDGKPYKTLRRHLSTNGLTPEEYRERYNLKADYPMVSQSYSESRRAMAKKIGLGRKPGQKAPAGKAKTGRSAKDAAQAHLSGE